MLFCKLLVPFTKFNSMRLIISFLALIFCGCISNAQSVQAPADLLLLNGKIWTGEPNTPFAEAIAITGNRIVVVGTTHQVKKMAGAHTTIINLKGKLVTAGINDAHIHFLAGSLGLSAIDLYNAQTMQEAIDTVANYARANPGKAWLTGMGWQYSLFPGDMPTRQMLDSISGDRPAYIRAYDGHSAWVNSKALALAGITKHSHFDGFGKIYKDADGEPTGALTEGAMQLVAKLVPEPARQEKLDALRTGMRFAAKHGITTIQNASGSAAEFSLYEELLRNGELTLRASTAFTVGEKTTEKDIADYSAIKQRIAKHPMLRAGCVKFFLDGVIESHTAAMLQPYSDVAPDSKMANSDFALPLDTYRRLVSVFDKAGFQIYTHAIGDRSVREALNAYENAGQLNGTKDARHRIEHIETSSPDDLPRFKALGVIASMQPIHADPASVEVWGRAVGAQRLPQAFVWASMLQNNARLVYSSDWPACATPIPIRGLHNAVNRRTINGIPAGGWVPAQKVSITDALVAYTQGGAYASFDEKEKGKLQPGYLADIIVFSQDLFSIAPMDIYKTHIELTIMDGKIVYRDKNF
ncbi:MAG: hypothetical protein RL172_3322 [Bacteroidota bacterium]